MDHIIEHISDRLAASTTRRGFLGRMTRLSLGGAAALAGGAAALTAIGTAEALDCCGTSCQNNTCPPNTTFGEITYCCFRGNTYQCVPCLSIPSKDYICTVSNYDHSGCQGSRSQATR